MRAGPRLGWTREPNALVGASGEEIDGAPALDMATVSAEACTLKSVGSIEDGAPCAEDIDYLHPRGPDRAVMRGLVTREWLRRRRRPWKAAARASTCPARRRASWPETSTRAPHGGAP